MSAIEVEVQWACVQTPNTKYTPQWCVDMLVTKEQADSIIKESKTFHSSGVKLKKEEDGRYRFKISRDVTQADGETLNKPVLVRDRRNRDFDGLVGNGSICKVLYGFFAWNNKFGSGVGVDFKGLQVMELVPYEGGEFEDEGELEDTDNVDKGSDKFDDEDL